MATLRLYNTLTRRKEDFAPIDPAHIRLYACGPTVYDDAHIGNARPIIVFDVLFRLLRHLAETGAFDGGEGKTRVTYARNLTDVDDRINERAAERGISIRDLTDQTIARFHEDIAALGVVMPTDLEETRHRLIEPRATDHIEEMKALIERLVAAGHAYVAADNVLFSVPSMPDYGSLSKRPLDEMEAGARVDVAPYKRSPLDFVLWKPSGANDPGWPSPCGITVAGRPGWHIECSAMSWKHLGETFDIHAGGIDLVFPHHENEIAQSRCCFGTPVMAKTWLHNGFLQVEGAKMAKSAGNFVTMRELLASSSFGERKWYGPTLRLAMLGTDYRQPIDWTLSRLGEADAALSTFATRIRDVVPDGRGPPEDFLAALLDDLNTPAAITEMHRLSRVIRRGARREREDAQQDLYAALAVIGLEKASPLRAAVEQGKSVVNDRVIQERIDLRLSARASKNWAESDRIRDELAAMGIRLKDNKDGTTTWEVAP